MGQNNKKQEKIEYLKMIQEPISRMSSTSAIFKGFSATIVAGILSFFKSRINFFPIFVGIFFVAVFAILDTYYLSLERKFRLLFEQVAKDQHPIDFSIKPVFNHQTLIDKKINFLNCLRSPSICLFYLPLLLFLFVTILLKHFKIL